MGLPDGATREWLDAQYNARALVGDHAAIFARWREESARLRAELGADRTVEVRYGDDPRQAADVHLPAATGTGAGTGRPMLVFVHGGYWHSLEKETFSFLAAPFLERGVVVANLDYRLVPAVALADVVADVRAGVAALARRADELGVDPARLVASGHSAGGHLVAMLMTEDWSRHGLPDTTVRAGCGISGLYDLEPIRRSYLDDTLDLSPDEAHRLGPVHARPTSSGPLVLTCGGDEPGEFDRQQRELAAAWGDACEITIVPQPDGHHFDACDRLAAPGPVHDAVLGLLGVDRPT